MAEASNVGKLLNTWLLHLKKLCLELTCPLCLNLLNRPMLLPCNHIFCDLCIPRSTQFGSECCVCKTNHAYRDVRPAPYMENLVTIYKNLDAAFSNARRVPQQPPAPLNTNVDKELKSSVETPREENSSNGQSVFSLTTNKRVQAPSQEENPENINDSTKRHPAKMFVENNPDNVKGGTKDGTPPRAGESHARDIKRQKKSNDGLFDMGVKSNSCTQPNVFHCESVATSKLESKFGEVSGAKAPSGDANKSICAFCRSSGLTDITGPMLHFINEKEVKGDATTKSNVIHVHRRCIEWTPQIYFDGEKIKNLKTEMARAAKLKCGRCGIRGAALGCFEKSCHKSYHVPCAVEVLDCRWDVDDFLMLCPNHTFVKFPREKSKFGKHASEEQHHVPTEIISKQSNFWGASQNGVKKWVFCGSALSAEEKYLLVKFASICGATVSKYWKPNVTHVIAATDEKGACSRTLKLLKAILNGRWILKIDWIKACMEAMHPIDEEPYEVSLDNHGRCDGPKSGRLRSLDNAPKLFHGFNFYFIGDFIPIYQEELVELVIIAGGTVIGNKEGLFKQNHDDAQATRTLVVYNNDPAQWCKIEDEEGCVVEPKRLKAAEDLANEIGSQAIGHTWLLESIAASKVQSLALAC